MCRAAGALVGGENGCFNWWCVRSVGYCLPAWSRAHWPATTLRCYNALGRRDMHALHWVPDNRCVALALRQGTGAFRVP